MPSTTPSLTGWQALSQKQVPLPAARFSSRSSSRPPAQPREMTTSLIEEPLTWMFGVSALLTSAISWWMSLFATLQLPVTVPTQPPQLVLQPERPQRRNSVGTHRAGAAVQQPSLSKAGAESERKAKPFSSPYVQLQTVEQRAQGMYSQADSRAGAGSLMPLYSVA